LCLGVSRVVGGVSSSWSVFLGAGFCVESGFYVILR
jgi:hypothetical protein